MRGLQRRLAKLEAWRYLAGGGPWLFLPHKSSSAEQWAQETAERFQHREEWQGYYAQFGPVQDEGVTR